MRQPFSLDQALREQTSVGVAQKQARQRMFDKQAAEATMILNQKIKELQKKAQKGAGLFKGLGKNAPWVKYSFRGIRSVWQSCRFSNKSSRCRKNSKRFKKI